jgi:hypothetical protein
MVVAVRAILESVSGAMTLAAQATMESGPFWSENARMNGRRLVMFQAYIVSSALMSDRNPSGLLKVLGVAFGLAIIVGNTIDRGFFVHPAMWRRRCRIPRGSSATRPTAFAPWW